MCFAKPEAQREWGRLGAAVRHAVFLQDSLEVCMLRNTQNPYLPVPFNLDPQDQPCLPKILRLVCPPQLLLASSFDEETPVVLSVYMLVMVTSLFAWQEKTEGSALEW